MPSGNVSYIYSTAFNTIVLRDNTNDDKKYSRRKAIKTGAAAFLATGSLGALATQRASAHHTTKLTISTSGEYTIQIDGTVESTANLEDQDSVTDKGSYYEITGGPLYSDEDIIWFSGNIKKVQVTGDKVAGKLTFEGTEQYSSQDTVKMTGTGEYEFAAADSVSPTDDCETGLLGEDRKAIWSSGDGEVAAGSVAGGVDTWNKSGSIRFVYFRVDNSNTVTLTHY